MIQPHELHRADLTCRLLNNLLHLRIRCCSGHPRTEFGHIRSADRSFNSRDNGFCEVMLQRCTLTWRVGTFGFPPHRAQVDSQAPSSGLGSGDGN
jgi:hypothetical protein